MSKFKCSVLALTVLALSGCGEKSDIENAINKNIENKEYCYSLQDNDISFPITIGRDNFSQDFSPILKGLANQGLVTLHNQGYRDYVISLTEKGAKTDFWDKKRGVCMGKRVVDDIKEWTEGEQNTLMVTYTEKLVDVPRWVDKKSFSDIEGMDSPAEKRTVLKKTSNGWKVWN